MIVLSPKAISHLSSYSAPWPVPYMLNLRKQNRDPLFDIFNGITINTPSMLCVEDALLSLKWAKSLGGLPGLLRRSHLNFQAVFEWVESRPWVRFLASDMQTQSRSNVCLQFFHNDILLSNEHIKQMVQMLADEGVAYDIMGYKGVSPNIRLWIGPTIEVKDIQILLEWIDWAFKKVI